MDKIVTLLNNYNKEIKIVMTVVIGIVAVVFISILLMKAMKELHNQAIGSAAKNVGFAVLVALLAWMGISGVISLMTAIQPGEDLGVSGGNFKLIVDNSKTITETVLKSKF